MQSGKPSATAFRVAMRRAAHQLVDSPKILDDPLALRIIGPEAEEKLRASLAGESALAARALRVYMAVRSRFAEDELAVASKNGVRQFVVLGAGLDTSTYRQPRALQDLKLFEVDHPATQGWKRRLLAKSGISLPPTLAFVPVDFETQNLADELKGSGFNRDQAAFFSWLGVTMYLTPEAFTGTLRFIATLPKTSAVAFDYAIAPSALRLIDRLIYWGMARRVAKVGEPFRMSFHPEALALQLHELGFGDLLDLGANELNERYCRDRADGLQIGRLARMMRARVD
jgi:methyltransferase (TIGR00027 family)